MVILCGDSLHEIEIEADCQARSGEKFVVCFSGEAILVALHEARSFGATVILCGEHGKRATLRCDPAPCLCKLGVGSESARKELH